MQKALSLWEERERTRTEILAQVYFILPKLRLTGAKAASSRGTHLRKLAGEVKQRGRVCLEGETGPAR